MKKQEQVLKTGKSLSVPDYEIYEMNPKELMMAILLPLGIIAFMAILCYNSIFFAIILLPYIPFYVRERKRKLKDMRSWKLNMQFRDCINCISSALESGYSIENAIKEAYMDMKLSYDENEMIMKEMRMIINKLENNRTVEEVILNFAERSGLDDVRSFADIFATAKRTGGNLILIIKSTADVTALCFPMAHSFISPRAFAVPWS